MVNKIRNGPQGDTVSKQISSLSVIPTIKVTGCMDHSGTWAMYVRRQGTSKPSNVSFLRLKFGRGESAGPKLRAAISWRNPSPSGSGICKGASSVTWVWHQGGRTGMRLQLRKNGKWPGGQREKSFYKGVRWLRIWGCLFNATPGKKTAVRKTNCPVTRITLCGGTGTIYQAINSTATIRTTP